MRICSPSILFGLIVFLELAVAVEDDITHLQRTFEGKSYFSPGEPLHPQSNSEFTEDSFTISKDEIYNFSSETSSDNFSDDYSTFEYSCSSDYPIPTSSSSSSSSSSVEIKRIEYQRPWCPGQLMASLIPQAYQVIYDWRDPLTCLQFAGDFGGVKVLVGELAGTNYCTSESTYDNLPFSNYTITRGLSINEPVYANTLIDGVEYATAAGPLFLPEGKVFYISVAKEVSKLPQVCDDLDGHSVL